MVKSGRPGSLREHRLVSSLNVMVVLVNVWV